MAKKDLDPADEIQTSAEAFENQAMPGAHVVHANPGATASAEQRPLPEAVARKPFEKKSAAEWAYERLILYIQAFEEQLDADHEMAAGFAGADTGIVRIEGIGYYDPDIVTFYGTDEFGGRTQLIQHVSQLAVTLRAMPKATDTKEPVRIGFRLVADLDRKSRQ